MLPVIKKYKSLTCLVLALIVSQYSYSQATDKTLINGIVIDAKTGFPLTGVSVLIDKTTVGTITDHTGKYIIDTKIHADKIVFSFIGYKTESRTFSDGKVQTINISLKLSSISLDEVIIKPGKTAYKNKNNPAVELIDKVIHNKDLNNEKSFEFLQFKQYDKIQFALSNISEKFKNGPLLGKFRFVFDNLDTTKRIGNTIPVSYTHLTLPTKRIV